MSDLEYACCFCMAPTKPTDGEMMGVARTDVMTGDFIQTWFAHFKCFANALHPNARIFRPDEDADDDLDWENLEQTT